MALRDPVHIYDAATNQEASLIQMFLERNGIEAFEVDDTSLAGVWISDCSQVFTGLVFGSIESTLICAKALIDKYECDRRKQNAVFYAMNEESEPLHVVCEDCNKASDFPASKRGTTQDCPHWGAYVDVGDVELFEDEE